MKYIPLKHFLAKPLKLKTGNVYYEADLDKAIEKFEAQFKVKNLAQPDVIKSVCPICKKNELWEMFEICYSCWEKKQTVL